MPSIILGAKPGTDSVGHGTWEIVIPPNKKSTRSAFLGVGVPVGDGGARLKAGLFRALLSFQLMLPVDASLKTDANIRPWKMMSLSSNALLVMNQDS